MSKNDAAVMGFHSIKNKPHFNRFNLGRRNLFTAKIGQLLPIFCEEVLPGDEINIDMTHFSRSMPIQTAAFTRLKENIQFFYVPYSALWSFYREAMQNMTLGQNGQNISHRASGLSDSVDLATALPSFPSNAMSNWLRYCLKNFADASFNNVAGSHALRVTESARLLQALGYGNFTSFSKLQRNDENDPTRISLDGVDVDITDIDEETNGVSVSPFRLLAYHKIANDFYRYDKWQEYVASSCNVDYLSQTSPSMTFGQSVYASWGSSDNYGKSFLFDMEYSNLPLDRFNGGLPNSQFGDESVVSLSSGGTLNALGGYDLSELQVPSVKNINGRPVLSVDLSTVDSSTSNNVKVDSTGTIGSDGASHTLSNLALNDTNTVNVPSKFYTVPVPNGSPSLSILALRRATALQRYKEIQECNDADFCSQIEAHFGVKPNSHGSKAKFIGGYSSVFDINPQINQNLTGDNVANIQAAPTSNGNGHCKFKVGDDYGVVIGIYRITPQLDYAGIGLDSRVLMTDASDYPIPELDSIGMDTLKVNDLYKADAPFFGHENLGGVNTSYAYAPRYINWKTSFDRYQGAYLSSLRTWVTGQDSAMIKSYADISTVGGSMQSLTSDLLYCPPKLIDNIMVNNKHDGIDNDHYRLK